MVWRYSERRLGSGGVRRNRSCIRTYTATGFGGTGKKESYTLR